MMTLLLWAGASVIFAWGYVLRVMIERIQSNQLAERIYRGVLRESRAREEKRRARARLQKTQDHEAIDSLLRSL